MSSASLVKGDGDAGLGMGGTGLVYVEQESLCI